MIKDDLFSIGNEFNWEYFCKHYKLIAIDLSRQNSIFTKSFVYCIKMESQKIINLLDHKDDDDPKFQTKKWYIINDLNGQYGNGNENEATAKFSTDVVKPFLVDYSDAYVLVTGDIKIVSANDATKVALKSCPPFTRALIKLNDQHVENAYHLDLAMNLNNLINYSDNYADTTAFLYHYKRPDQTKSNNDALENIADDSTSFKYQWELIKKQANPVNVGQKVDPNVANVHRA